MTQAVNRIGHMVPAGQIPEHRESANRAVADYVIHCGDELSDFVNTNPGEQPWIVVLDMNDRMVMHVEKGVRRAHGNGPVDPLSLAGLLQRGAAARAAAGVVNRTATVSFVATWDFATCLLKLMAENEAQAQTLMDEARGQGGAMALVTLHGKTQIFRPWNPWGDAGNAERERRRHRARRHDA
jgi:hypothetical protein